MKVWHLISNRWNSAISEYALSSALSLKALGVECFVFALKDSPIARRARDNGLHVHEFTSFGVMNWPEIFFQKISPTHVITYGGPESVLSFFLQRYYSCKVFRFRGDAKSPSLFSHIFSLFHADGVIVPSENSKQNLLQISAWRKNKIHLIELGVNASIFYFEPRSESYPRSIDLLIFGRFDPIKGHIEFLSIFKKFLAGRSDSLKIHFVGEAANLDKFSLQRSVESLGLAESVVISEDRVASVRELMLNTTLGVIPSLSSEVICRVAEEFLMCGTPIFVNDIGSLKNVLFEGAGDSFTYNHQSQAVEKLSAVFFALQENRTRQERADHAKRRFSYEAQGKSLLTLLSR